MLSKNQVSKICMRGHGHLECRYLDDAGHEFACKKKSVERKIIDEEVAEFIAECKAKGQNPKQQDVPLADNCQGYLPLSSLLQGYDI